MISWFFPSEKVACIDASFVLGEFLKIARDFKKAKSKRELNYKIQIRPDKRLKDMLESGTLLFITPITKYEILKRLMFKEGLNFNDAKNIVENRKKIEKSCDFDKHSSLFKILLSSPETWPLILKYILPF